MNQQKLTLEQTLYILIFILALALRLINLGEAPLTENEAHLALQAFQLGGNEQLAFDESPGYILLTGLIFFLFGSSNFMARALPAITGSLVIWMPYSLRRIFGQKASLILAFTLALDPALVGLSRQANGTMMAITLSLFAIMFWYHRKFTVSLICGCLAFLAGTSFIHGAISLLLAWGIWNLMVRYKIFIPSKEKVFQTVDARFDRAMILNGIVILIALSTWFFYIPQGLGAAARVVPNYLSGWLQRATLPPSWLIFALVFYQPLALVLGFIATIKCWIRKNNFMGFLSLWSFTALLLTLIFPAKQVGYLSWVVIPLWGLAASELSHYMDMPGRDKFAAIGQATLLFILFALSWINLSSMASIPQSTQADQLRLGILAGSLAMGAITTILVALGWSPQIAKRGLVWGVSSALLIYIFANTFGMVFPRWRDRMDLWNDYPFIEQSDLLLETLGDIAESQTGIHDTLDIIVLMNSPSMRWLLREWHGVRFTSEVVASELPSVIIQPEQQEPLSLTAAYRGQDFGWRVYPGWQDGLPSDWVNWLTFRRAPKRIEKVILWARSDLFPDNPAAVNFETLPLPSEDNSSSDKPVK